MEDTIYSYTTKQVCQILNISRMQFYELVKSGRLKAYSVGTGSIRKTWRVNKEDLEAFTHGQV